MVAAKAGLEQAGSNTFAKAQGKLLSEGFSFSGYERDSLYLNLGNKKFENISGVSGIDSLSDGRGAVFADFDNDGDNDVFLTTIQGQAHLLFRNNVGQENGFIRVTLEGRQSGRDAYGALVSMKTSRGIQTKTKSGGGGFNSQADPRLVFGLGKDHQAEWVEVRWPSGKRQRWQTVAANTSIRMVEGEPQFQPIEEKRFRLADPISKTEIHLRNLKVKVQEPFPPLTLASLEKEIKTRMDGLLKPGQLTLVNLWATWCVPCAREMPQLQEIYEKHHGKLQILGISLDPHQKKAAVQSFLKRHHITYPNFLGPSNMVPRIYATDEVFLPLSFLLDEQGRIQEIIPGWSDQTQARLRRLLE